MRIDGPIGGIELAVDHGLLQLGDLGFDLVSSGGAELEVHDAALHARPAALGLEGAVADLFDDLGIGRPPVPVRHADAAIARVVAGVGAVIGQAPFPRFAGGLHRAGRIRTGDDDVVACVEQGLSRLAFGGWIEPGVDPDHLHLGVGVHRAGAFGHHVDVADDLRDGEGRHIANLAIFGSHGRSHARQIFHLIHAAKKIVEVRIVLLITGDMDKDGVGEFLGHSLGRVHIAEGRGEDHIVALLSQVADDAFRIRAFGHRLDIGRLHVGHVLFHVKTSLVVGVRPTAIANRPYIDPGRLDEFGLLGFGRFRRRGLLRRSLCGGGFFRGLLGGLGPARTGSDHDRQCHDQNGQERNLAERFHDLLLLEVATKKG